MARRERLVRSTLKAECQLFGERRLTLDVNIKFGLVWTFLWFFSSLLWKSLLMHHPTAPMLCLLMLEKWTGQISHLTVTTSRQHWEKVLSKYSQNIKMKLMVFIGLDGAELCFIVYLRSVAWLSWPMALIDSEGFYKGKALLEARATYWTHSGHALDPWSKHASSFKSNLCHP